MAGVTTIRRTPVWGGPAARNAGLGIGTQATVEPLFAQWLIQTAGSLAGIWPAIMVGGQVYVARFHNVAWEMAGRGEVQKYAFVILDAAGKVVGWK